MVITLVALVIVIVAFILVIIWKALDQIFIIIELKMIITIERESIKEAFKKEAFKGGKKVLAFKVEFKNPFNEALEEVFKNPFKAFKAFKNLKKTFIIIIISIIMVAIKIIKNSFD